MKREITLLIAVIGMAACGKDDSTRIDVSAPTVLALEPDLGTVGTEVRIEGSGFSSTVQVRFDDLEAPRVLNVGGNLFAVAPQGLVEGRTYRVSVWNEGIEPDSANLEFTVVAPVIDRVNGATRPSGLRGMTVILEGLAFSDSVGLSEAQVLFEGAGGAPLEGVVVDAGRDWTNNFIVTQVPQEIPDTTRIWVETPTGVSNAVEFRVIQSGLFSPSNINWTLTSDLPEPVQALDAVFVSVEDGATPANYVFTLGGTDAAGVPTPLVHRATVAQTGALDGGWTAATPLPGGLAYHTVVAATSANAPVDTTTTAGLLYVIGGLGSDGGPTTTTLVATIALDGTIGPWMATAPLPVALHSMGATVFAGWVYVSGGADSTGGARSETYRAEIMDDGSLGPWEASISLPEPSAFGSLVSFGPFIFSVGGETGTSEPVRSTQTGSETSRVYAARIDLRTRDLEPTGWSQTESMSKARSKHEAVFAGGSIFVTSGIYAGQPGSSENTFADLNSDGTIRPWQGATGSETIDVEIGISLYNQALVSFIDRSGVGHVLVLGGADRDNEGIPSGAVAWY